MSQLAKLLKQGQKFNAHHLSATIKIDGQSYECGASGLSEGQAFRDSGVFAVRRISFWLLQSALAAAGGAPLRSGMEVECTAPAVLAGAYSVETALPDAAGSTIIIRCTAPAQ